jgi:hypothetical protein
VIKRPEWQGVKREISGTVASYDHPSEPCHTPVVTRPLSTRRAKGLVLTPYSKVMHLSLNGGAHAPN